MAKKQYAMSSDELCQRVSDISGGCDVILNFSMGKESIACYYQLKKYFKNVHLIYKYIVPDLTFVNDGLRYFEEKFSEKIHVMPNIGFYKMINGNVFQTPEHLEIIHRIGLPNHTYNDYEILCREDLGLRKDTFIAIGVRASDSPTRAMVVNTYGPVSKRNTFYPIFDWSYEDLRHCLKSNDIKLPVDYEMFGKSFDGLDYRFIKPIKERYPEDYEKIKFFFPLIDLEILRYDNI